MKPVLTENAQTVLEKRYLWKDDEGRVAETPEELFWRVARAVAAPEGRAAKKWASVFSDLMTELRFLPNSPTLMNAGRKGGQLSACFVLPISDSLDSIFDTLKFAAKIHQSGGGTGFSFSRLRGAGSQVKSTHGVASGPISFMRIYDIATETIKQGGARRGANMAILRVDHPDILEFIDCKRDQKSITNFNISVGATAEFMRAVESGGAFPLRDPRSGEIVRAVPAVQLFERIATSAWECGDPGVVFLDRINEFNPTPAEGEMESTNPCVTGDTRVWVEEQGWVPIRELVGRTPRVSTESGSGCEFRPAIRVVRSGIKPVFRIRTLEGHEIRATAEHKVRTDRGDVPVKDLGTGDRLRLLEVLPPMVRRDSVDAREGESLAETEKPGFRLPESVWRGSADLQAGYLRVLFSGGDVDLGNPSPGWTPRLMTESFELLGEIQNLLLGIGVRSVVLRSHPEVPTATPAGDIRDLKRSARNTLAVTLGSVRAFSETVGYSLPHQQDRLLTAVALSSQPGYYEDYYTSVSEIVYDGEKEVFDLSEPVTHHFHGNGILIHNCGEQPLLPYESCNLGSINVSAYHHRDGLDWDRLARDIPACVRFLDNVIDINAYPIDECRRITLRNRKIGLGVMGFADLLLKLDLPYDSEEAVRLGERLMGFLDRSAKAASTELAVKKGPFPGFSKSLWKRLGYRSLRNATVSTVAPTGTISMIAGVSSGIEPIFSGIFFRNVLSGARLTEIHPAVAEAIKAHGGSVNGMTEDRIGEVLGQAWCPAHRVSVEAHVRMQSVFQRFSDSAVSKTVNLPHSATVADVQAAYLQAYRSGCKGITIYRDRSKPTQVLERAEDGGAQICPAC